VFSELPSAKQDNNDNPGQDQLIAALTASAWRQIAYQVTGLGIYTTPGEVIEYVYSDGG
jgi:hypothetical protein